MIDQISEKQYDGLEEECKNCDYRGFEIIEKKNEEGEIFNKEIVCRKCGGCGEEKIIQITTAKNKFNDNLEVYGISNFGNFFEWFIYGKYWAKIG